MDFSAFDFSSFGTFLTLDPSELLVGLGQAYTNIDPIVDRSIKILLCRSYGEIQNLHDMDLLAALMASGTKVFNAIYYLLAKGTFPNAFDVQLVESSSRVVLNDGIKKLVSCILIVLSRGSFPAQAATSINTELPKFIKAIMLNISTEGGLRKACMDFDPKHINMEKFLTLEKNFTGWDPILLNRMVLGVAGHKPFKVASILSAKIIVPTDIKRKTIIEFLINVGNTLSTGFYPTLHPMIQQFTQKYPNFYKSSLYLLTTSLPGTNTEKLALIRNTEMFKMDKFVTESIFNYPLNIDPWDVNSLSANLGQIIKFGVAKSRTVTIKSKINVLEVGSKIISDTNDDLELISPPKVIEESKPSTSKVQSTFK